MLVILITPPGVEQGLAVLDEMFGPLPAPRTVRPTFSTPAFTSSNPPSAIAEPTPGDTTKPTETSFPDAGPSSASEPAQIPIAGLKRESVWPLLWEFIKIRLLAWADLEIRIFELFEEAADDHAIFEQRREDLRRDIEKMAPEHPQVAAADAEEDEFPALTYSYRVVCDLQIKSTALKRALKSYKRKNEKIQNGKNALKAKYKRSKAKVQDLENKLALANKMARELHQSSAGHAQRAYQLQLDNRNLRGLVAQYQGYHQAFQNHQHYQGYGGGM
ncbi:MAG: hypothetical protein Q9195_000963 [Heterodermia aff. obscurata]